MIKKILLFLILVCSYAFVFAQHDMKNMPGMDTTKKANKQPAQQIFYTCVMHPEIHSAKPGNCPKCGMKLVKEKPKAVVPKTVPQIKNEMPASPLERGLLKDPAKQQHNMQDMQMENMSKQKEVTIKTVENLTPPKTVRYDLYVTDTIVNFTGKSKHAIAVNGSIPMPTLTFTEGDTAEIYVHNMMDEETSLHWHGLFVPNRYDGVPNLTQMPIKPHTTFLYRFPIIQHGTHWYHSHTELQEQIGMYGAMILNKRKESDIPTIPIVLSEWIDMKPEQVQRSLHNATDWFAIKKGTTQSYSEAIKSGHLKTKLANEWKRMNAMDVSDVAYDKFLINGKASIEYASPLSLGEGSGVRSFKAGDKVRLRIANAGASSYFWLSYSGGKIIVIATDGNDVEPVEVDRLIIAPSETYDVIVTVPENKRYEFLVTPEDRTKSASLWLGSGEKIAAARLPKLKYFAGMKMMNDMMAMNGDLKSMRMKMSNQMMDMNTVMYPEVTGEEKIKKGTRKSTMQMPNNSMQGMNMEAENSDIVTLNYTMLKATEKTILPSSLSFGEESGVRLLKFDLTGNMNRYVWTLDNKTVSESDKILIKKGENVRIVLYNNSMMRHPMHLHGHDFRLLNGQGDYAPLKNIIDIMPMERDTIEFAANESGDWFFHCHILYHMMSGMGRVFSYENSPPTPEIPNPKLAQRKLFADDRMVHFMAKAGLETNGTDGEAMLAQTRWKLSTMWHLGTDNMMGYESETMIGRYLGKMQWWYPYIGFDYHYKMQGGLKNIFGSEAKNWFGQRSNKDNRHTIAAGIAYTLPTLTVADIRVDGNGRFRFQLSREDIAVTPRLRFGWMTNTDKEYMAGLRYIVTKYISVSTHWDSDMGVGAGLTFTY
ncbi:MAG: multicopper oxidase domain-containing protein [Ferruginibacter sp.]